MPLYLMKSGEGEALKERLVEANNIQVARNFVARDIIQGEKAGQADLFRLAKAGVEIEVAIGAAEVDAELGGDGGGNADDNATKGEGADAANAAQKPDKGGAPAK